jgi:hypothetical protein
MMQKLVREDLIHEGFPMRLEGVGEDKQSAEVIMVGIKRLS